MFLRKARTLWSSSLCEGLAGPGARGMSFGLLTPHQSGDHLPL